MVGFGSRTAEIAPLARQVVGSARRSSSPSAYCAVTLPPSARGSEYSASRRAGSSAGVIPSSVTAPGGTAHDHVLGIELSRSPVSR